MILFTIRLNTHKIYGFNAFVTNIAQLFAQTIVRFDLWPLFTIKGILNFLFTNPVLSEII
jgi:hypothetical protein